MQELGILKKCSKCGLEKPTTEYSYFAYTADRCHSWCKLCMSADAKARRNADPVKLEKMRARARAYYHAHKEECLDNAKDYRKANPHKVTKYLANRRARIIQATPSWANQFFIEEAYHLAQLREAVVGGKWEVDHVIPLRGKNVCGLHVETNLAVITQTQNRSKHNSF